jgi:hypothetical protein
MHDADQAIVQGNGQGNCNAMGGAAAAHETLHGLHINSHSVLESVTKTRVPYRLTHGPQPEHEQALGEYRIR